MYSLPYLVLLCFLFFLFLNETGKLKVLSAKQCNIIAFVILLFFLGLRGHIYSDFISYYPFYEELPNVFELNKSTFQKHILFEPGFIVYSSIVKTLVPSYYGWVFVNTLIDLIVLYITFKRYSKSIILSFIIFIVFSGLLMEFNLYRNMKALDLFFLSIPYLLNRKLLPYVILNVLGCTFHSTSILYIPLYFILARSIPMVIIWGGIIVVNIIFLGDISVIGNIAESLNIFQNMNFYGKFVSHIANSDTGYKLSLGYIEKTIGVIMLSVLYSKLKNVNYSNVVFFNCYWLYYISSFFFYEIEVFTSRIPLLFVFGYWILYANIFYLNYRLRQLIMLFIIVLSFIKVNMVNSIPPARYENILFGIDSYDTRTRIYRQYEN